eukprot:TRINITY_DN26_c0_g1_i1.p1 TRINITY_DN26_c0_g1~~TRINITY_DN26_c0_g1_i1.p1  ORF type:complete len:323 (+),score=74.06 TRINITY_DN26_c0_g1_i1:207-1175(+)
MTRRIGDFEINPIGLGCMGLSAFYEPRPTEEEGIELLRKAVDAGYNFFDTASVYGPMTNEVLVGKAFKDVRDKVVVATKWVFKLDGSFEIDGSPENARATCEGCLERLGVDQIDLFYMHRMDKKRDIEESVQGMADLVKEGKVKYIGLSEVGSENIRRAHAVHPITAVQTEYSLFSLDVENDVLDTCKELGITLVAYSPLGRGFLTGAITSPDDLEENDWRRTNPRFQGENFAKNLELVEFIKEFAEEKGCTPAQLALAWVLAQGDNIVVIPGTTKEKYMLQNMGANDVVLTEDDLARIRERLNQFGPTQGDRYGSMASIDT